jgi:hypothetical protein
MVITKKKSGDSPTAKKFWKPQMEVILEELVIKDDVNNHSMRFYEWASKEYSGNFIFGLPINETEDDEIKLIAFALLTIHPDGHMDFSRHDFYDADVDDRLSSIGTWIDAEYVVMDPSGNINIVRKTDIITVPPISAIEDKIAKNIFEEKKRTKGIRDADGRPLYLSECVDINVIEISKDRWLYYVGEIGYGVGPKFNHAANVREIIPFEGSKLFFDKILDLMAVPFVRHNKSTVVPFPLKYLREWIESHIVNS